MIESETQATFETTEASLEDASVKTTVTLRETMSSSSGQKKARMLNTACTGGSCVSAKSDSGKWVFCLCLLRMFVNINLIALVSDFSV